MQFRRYFSNFFLVICSLFLTCLIMEGILRFFPVSTGIKIQPVNAQNPIFRAYPNRKIHYSRLWNFESVRTKNINNAGFINSQDYVANDPKPLLAVVGDSYIEAMQVQDEESYPAILQQHAKNMRVYSFGFSGAPLSQYLIWAQHAKQNYNNNYLIINVVGNDFDESLPKYFTFMPGFSLYSPTANGELQLQRHDWQPSFARELAKKSYLLSYLVRNVEVVTAKDRIKAIFTHKQQQKFVANTAADADQQRLTDSYQAIDAFFRDLPQYAGLDAKHIMFVIDDRTTAYDTAQDLQALEQSYFHLIKKYFTAKAKQNGYAFIDMAVPFNAHYQQNSKPFQFIFDNHWNSLGHSVVADAIMQSDWWQQLG